MSIFCSNFLCVSKRPYFTTECLNKVRSTSGVRATKTLGPPRYLVDCAKV